MEHRIVILGHKHPADVTPSRVMIKGDDTVTFEARSTTARVFFPVCPFEGMPIPLVLEDRIPSQAFAIKREHREKFEDQYPYSVYCQATNSFAQGNSDPLIIIHR